MASVFAAFFAGAAAEGAKPAGARAAPPAGAPPRRERGLFADCDTDSEEEGFDAGHRGAWDDSSDDP
jgi:hypothetical protein